MAVSCVAIASDGPSERLFAWLHWFRRLVIRWEYHAENFLGMVRLGCMKIMLRYLWPPM